MTLNKGRYGPYVKHGRINASIPKGVNEDDVTLEQALELISARAAKGASKTKPKSKAKKSAKPKKKPPPSDDA